MSINALINEYWLASKHAVRMKNNVAIGMNAFGLKSGINIFKKRVMEKRYRTILDETKIMFIPNVT